MLIGNLHADSPPIDERLATAMGSCPLFLGDLRKLTPTEQNWYSEKIGWFKTLRKEVPIQEGFFPLGSWRQPGAATWDGFARLSRQGEGMMALFKNQARHDQIELKLSTFPDGTYRVRSVMTGKALGSFTGEQFRQGIQFRIPAEYKVELLEIRK
jgi:hypothetical protein